jgi:hypothetical protein
MPRIRSQHPTEQARPPESTAVQEKLAHEMNSIAGTGGPNLME